MTRRTQAKQVILDTFYNSPHPLSVAELHSLAKKKLPSLGLATTYRRVKELFNKKDIKEIHLPKSPKKYALNPSKHLHYFQCLSCQKTFGLYHCIGNFEKMLPKGFKLESHEVILYGQCLSCIS